MQLLAADTCVGRAINCVIAPVNHLLLFRYTCVKVLMQCNVEEAELALVSTKGVTRSPVRAKNFFE